MVEIEVVMANVPELPSLPASRYTKGEIGFTFFVSMYHLYCFCFQIGHQADIKAP